MISPSLAKLIEDDMLFTYCEYSRSLEVNVPFSNFTFMVNYTPQLRKPDSFIIINEQLAHNKAVWPELYI